MQLTLNIQKIILNNFKFNIYHHYGFKFRKKIFDVKEKARCLTLLPAPVIR